MFALPDDHVTSERFPCAICGKKRHMAVYDVELPSRLPSGGGYVHSDLFVCRHCISCVAKADVALRMAGYSRPKVPKPND